MQVDGGSILGGWGKAEYTENLRALFDAGDYVGMAALLSEVQTGKG